MPGWSALRTASAALRTNVRSGVLESSNGVGTEMKMASATARSAAPTSAEKAPLPTRSATTPASTSSMWLCPWFRACDPLGVDVEADDAEAGLGEADHQGQADVAETDHRDDEVALGNPASERFGRSSGLR